MADSVVAGLHPRWCQSEPSAAPHPASRPVEAQSSGIGRPKASRVMSVGLRAAALIGVQGVDRGELVGAQLEVEHVEVLRDAVRLGRLRDDGAALLQVPAQHHLRRGLAVGLGDLADHRVLERAAVLAVAVEGDAADRRPRLGQDAVLGAERLDLALLEVRVHLDLVDRRHDRRLRQERGEVVDHEVADPDGAHLAVVEQRLQRPVRLQGLVELRRQRLVQDQQVDLVDAELARRSSRSRAASRRSRSR